MNIKKEILKYETKFESNVLEIAAVTGSSGLGAGKVPADTCWRASIGITAWQDINGGEVHIEEKCSLTKKVENTDGLRKKLKSDTIITAKVRKSKSDNSFLIVDVTNKNKKFPELEKVLEEQLKPVYYIDEILGEFELDKSVNSFEGYIEWRGGKVRLSFDKDTDEEMNNSVSVARRLFENQEEWDSRILKYTAGELIELANDWLDETDSEITEDEFTKRISLDGISIGYDGSFSFWYNDDDIFGGHIICVSGSIEGSLTDAGIHG